VKAWEEDGEHRGGDWTEAQVHLRKGEVAEALVFFQKVVAAEPTDFDALIHVGYCESVLGEWEKATQAYENALEIQDDAVIVYLRLGGVYLKQDRWQDAMKVFSEAVELDADDALVFCNLALALGELGRFDEALKAVQKAVDLQPEFAFAHYETGWLYSRLEQWQDAADAFKKAVEIEPEFAKAHFNLGVNCLILGDIVAAKKSLIY